MSAKPWLPLAAAAGLAPAVANAEPPADLEPLTWWAAPDTKVEAVQADPELYEELRGNSGFRSVVGAWSGAALDTNRLRLVIWGGGHNDYYGNELYAFDIESLTWERLTDPTLDWNNCGDPNSDGTPNGRHTYGGLAYIEHADRFFASGGSLNCTTGSCGADLTWVFDFDTNTWTNRNPTGSHSTGCENSSAYDPTTGTLYYNSTGGLFAYDYDDNTWTNLSDQYTSRRTATVDTKRGQLILVGRDEVWAYDIAGGNYERQILNTSGADEFIAGNSVGLDYDPVTDRVVGWAGGPVYALDLDSLEWTAYDVEGAPEPTNNGIFGRWRYVPDVNAFVLVTAVDVDVHFFKLSEGGMIPEGSDESGDGGTDDGGGTSTTDGGSATTDPSTTAGSTNGSGDTNTPTTGAGSSGPTSGAADGEGGEEAGDDSGGCGCTHRRNPPALVALFALGLLARRRRR